MTPTTVRSAFARPALGLITLAFGLGGATAAHCQNYAASVVSASNLGTNSSYNNPAAALGQPTTLSFDGTDTFHSSIVYPAYGTTPDGSNTLVSLGHSGLGTVTVKLAAPITHSDSHWYGDDFIVYGNAQFFSTDFATITPTTDMSQTIIGGDYGIYQNGTPTVSVSADGINFTTLTTTQTFFPENPYAWTGITADNLSGWGALNDFTKPVDPSLTVSDFVGQSAAYDDNALYNGSAGGQAFSLAGSGLSSIQYIEFSGVGNIDGVAGVSDAPAAVPEASTVVSLGLLLLGLGAVAVRRRKTAV